MKIKETLNNGKLNLSLEVFPPKEWAKYDDSIATVEKMCKLSPSFMSVTYGAAGGTRTYTKKIAEHIQNTCGVTAIAHLTCVGTNKEQCDEMLKAYKDSGIGNVLALRGDIPDGSDYPKDFIHASDLITYIKENSDLCVGGACYPEGHPEAPSLESDIDALKIKEECGVDFLTTQMFFDNNIFYCFLNKMYQKNIKVPVIAGIMPITNAKQVKTAISLSGSVVPPRFKAIVEKFGNNPAAMQQAGIIYATEQIIDLYANGVHNVHIYTMNKPHVASAIKNNLSEILK